MIRSVLLCSVAVVMAALLSITMVGCNDDDESTTTGTNTNVVATITGVWAGETDASVPISMVLVQEDDAVVGSFVRVNAGTVSGSISGSSIEMTMTTETPVITRIATWLGQINGDMNHMEGTFEEEDLGGGNLETGTWTVDK
jgi:uncharacterized lipoprotein YehR (DUF1307 family)